MVKHQDGRPPRGPPGGALIPCVVVGSGVVRIDPLHFQATKPGLVGLSYLSMFELCCSLSGLLFLRIISFRWYVFCLLVVLKLSLLAK